MKRLPDPAETGTILPAVNGQMPDPIRPLGGAGRQSWDHILGSGAAWIAGSDLPMLQQTCELIDEQQALRMKVLDPTPRRDQWRDRKALRALDEQIRKQLSELGLSPTARTRLGLAQVTAAAIHENTENRKSQRRGKMFDEDGIIEAVVVDEEPPPVKLPRRSWTKGKVVQWFIDNGVEYRDSWTKNDLLEQAGVK